MMTVAAPGWALMLLLFSGAPINLLLSIPPLPQDAVMQQLAPEKCLWYLSLSGTDKANANSKSQPEQLVAEDDVQQFVREVKQQIETAFAKAAPEDPIRKTLGEEGPKLIETLFTRPMSVYISTITVGQEGPIVRAGMAINLGSDAAATTASLEKIEHALATVMSKKIAVDAKGWRTLPLPPGAPPAQWSVRDRFLLLGLGEGEAQKLDERRMNAKAPPEWLANIHRQLKVERPAMVQYIDVESGLALAQPVLNGILPAEELTQVLLEVSGAKNAKYYASVSGLDGAEFVSKGLLAIDGAPRGVLSVIGGQSLNADSLSTIPEDSSFAIAARLDPDKAFEAFVNASALVEPTAPVSIATGLAELKQTTGVHLQNDLLASLGDTWCAYNSPEDGGVLFTGLTVTATLRDHDKLVQVNDQLVGVSKQMMEQAAREGEGARTISDVEFRGQKIFFINFLTAESPVAPAWCITDDHLIVSLFPQAIKSYLQRLDHAGKGKQGETKSLANVPAVAKLFSDGRHPTVISYQDTPAIFKLVYPIVQMIAQFGFSSLQEEGIPLHIGMWPNARAITPHLVPTVDTVEATKDGLRFESRGSMPLGIGTLPLVALPVGIFLTRADMVFGGQPPVVNVGVAPAALQQGESSEKLHRLAEGVLSFESSSNCFPAAFASDKNGKPLLSWRVAILPFIGEEDLASQFKLDEPWDSENNKKLIERMPDVFKAPGSKSAEEFKTVYLSVRGDKTVFPGAKPIKLRSITDGAEQTIMFVEASDDHAVVWTKPDDFEPDDKNPIAGLVSLRENGFLAVYCDGHVELLPAEMDAAELKALFTRNGNDGATKPIQRNTVLQAAGQ